MIVFSLLIFSSFCAVGTDTLFRLPVTAVITATDNSGKTWKQNGYLPVTYANAVKQMSASLRGSGWSQVRFIDMKTERCLMVWKKNKKEITIMMWKVLVDQTGFSWG